MHKLSTIRQSGFGHIVTMALIVLVFSAVGYIGYKLYAHPLDGASQGSGQTSSVQLNVPAAPTIKTAKDLDTASSVLDQVDPGATSQSDSSQLDSQLNSF